MSNELSKSRQERTRDQIVEAALELFIECEEVSMRAVAQHAGIGERTIYRYFESRELLAEALRAEIKPRASVAFVREVEQLHDYADRLFEKFEENEALVHALCVNPTVAAEFARTRTQWRRRYGKLLRRAYPDVADERIEAGISILRGMLSGTGWSHLRHAGVSSEAAKAQAHWTIDLVLDALAAEG